MPKKLTTQEVRKSNRNSIIRALHENSQMSKQEIAYFLNLSMPTVTQNLKELEAEGLIENKGRYESTGGRKARKISFVYDAKISIGVELSYGHMSLVAIDLSARVIFEEKLSFEEKQRPEINDIEGYKERLIQGLDSFITKYELDKNKILGIGIAVPGTLLNVENLTIIEQAPTLKLKSVILQDLVKDIPYNCIFNNDADAAGMAELWHNKELKPVVYIMIKNGVGAAILINNKLYSDENYRAGEVGHMTLVPGGLLCACGMKGCFEAYVRPQRLTERFNCELSQFFDSVDKGIPEYVEAFDEYLDYLAIGINNIRMLFDCDILIGGDINEYLERYKDKLTKIVENKNTFYDAADFLGFGYFKSNACSIGAALTHVENYLKGL